MAWLCQRCLKKIYPRQGGPARFTLEWRYRRRDGELSFELQGVQNLKDESIVTHIRCEAPEQDGFAGRIKIQLRMPKDAEHPLLI